MINDELGGSGSTRSGPGPAPGPKHDREAFLRGAADGILKEGLVSVEHYDRLASWLRTVWLAARGEEYGESVEVHGSEHWVGSPSEDK